MDMREEWKSIVEEYPPLDFCKENCKGSEYTGLIELEAPGINLGGNEHAAGNYYWQMSLARRAHCTECEEAMIWKLGETKKNLIKIAKEAIIDSKLKNLIKKI
ncbi:hypothetical protein HN903_03920 [archaeon]|jgi:hypothetical protein|nr:hypothetical protein [archaeon]MBT7128877.1 hypothetical protein [archaeon]